MNKENLVKYIQAIYHISGDLTSFIEDFEYFNLPKNELLIKENKINKQTYYLESGYIRSFTSNKNGQEVTTNIYFAPCFVNDFLSFFKQQPSKEYFQTLTPCFGWTMTNEDIDKNLRNSSVFREFVRILLVSNYDTLKERMLSMIKDSAENRYLNLLSKHPGIFQNVPLKIIASYLGITDNSLSKIRKGILQR